MKRFLRTAVGLCLLVFTLVNLPIYQVYSQSEESRISYINEVNEDISIDLADYQGIYSDGSNLLTLEANTIALDLYGYTYTGELELVKGNLYQFTRDSYTEIKTIDLAEAREYAEEDDYVSEMYLGYYENLKTIAANQDNYDEKYQDLVTYILDTFQVNADETELTYQLNGQEALAYRQQMDFETIPEEFKDFYFIFGSASLPIADYEQAEAYNVKFFKFEEDNITYYSHTYNPDFDMKPNEIEFNLIESHLAQPDKPYEAVADSLGPDQGLYLNKFNLMTYDGKTLTIKQDISDSEFEDEFIIYQGVLTDQGSGDYLLIPETMTIQVSGSYDNPQILQLIGNYYDFIAAQDSLPNDSEMGQSLKKYLTEDFILNDQDKVAFTLDLQEFMPWMTWLPQEGLVLKHQIFNNLDLQKNYQDKISPLLNTLGQYFSSRNPNGSLFYLLADSDSPNYELYQERTQGIKSEIERLGYFVYSPVSELESTDYSLDKTSDQLLLIDLLIQTDSQPAIYLQENYGSKDTQRSIQINDNQLTLKGNSFRNFYDYQVSGSLEALSTNIYKLNSNSLVFEEQYPINGIDFIQTIINNYQTMMSKREEYSGETAEFVNYLAEEVFQLNEDYLVQRISAEQADYWLNQLEEITLPEEVESISRQLEFPASFMLEEYNGIQAYGDYYIEATQDGINLYTINRESNIPYLDKFTASQSQETLSQMVGSYQQIDGQGEIQIQDEQFSANLSTFFGDEDQVMIKGAIEALQLADGERLVIDPQSLELVLSYNDPNHPLAEARQQLANSTTSETQLSSTLIDEILTSVWVSEGQQTQIKLNFDRFNHQLANIPYLIIRSNSAEDVFLMWTQKLLDFYLYPAYTNQAITIQFLSLEIEDNQLYLYHHYAFNDGSYLEREIGRFQKK